MHNHPESQNELERQRDEQIAALADQIADGIDPELLPAVEGEDTFQLVAALQRLKNAREAVAPGKEVSTRLKIRLMQEWHQQQPKPKSVFQQLLEQWSMTQLALGVAGVLAIVLGVGLFIPGQMGSDPPLAGTAGNPEGVSLAPVVALTIGIILLVTVFISKKS
jgi:hypothetical protein